jgi:ubiquinone/menaquinone biosynthesis C-methylase UbiE
MAREWFSSGFFDADMAGVLFDAEKLREAKAETAALARLAGLKKGAAVLDAACGVGRHSLEFARRGFQVAGVDITESYVREASRLAKREKLKNVEFQKGELRDLYRFQSSFDLVTNLFTSFGYYQKAADNFEALKQMAAALRKGGTLVMELMPRETLDQIFSEKSWQITRKGYLLQRRAWVDGGRKLRNDAIWVGKSGERETRSEIFVYAVPELAAMFRRAGLKSVKTFKNYRGQPWKTGERLVICGAK